MSFLPKFIRFCLSLRYQITVEGEEIIKKYKDTSLLFLANHPATIDPVIVLASLEPYCLIQPLAAEKFFKSPLITFFMKKLHALAVPEFENGSNEFKAYRVEKLTKELKEVLKNKAKVLLYPAGHLSDSTYEKIGGASLAFDLKDEPKKIIGLAIDGLYGSQFSRYFEKKTQPFLETLAQAFKIALCNGIFFLPKRKVTLRLFEIGEDIRSLKDRVSFNQALEQEFNTQISHVPQVVSYGVCRAPVLKDHTTKEHVQLDPELANSLVKMAEKVTGKTMTLDDHLSYDVGIDSLEVAEIMALVEQNYRLKFDVLPKTLRELGGLIANQQNDKMPKIKPLSPRQKLPNTLFEASNLLEAFYLQKNRNPNRRMASDLVMKEVSYKKAALIIELLATEINKDKSEYVGILLPSSIMAYLVILSVLLAGKKPVMLNWTGGRKSLDFAIDLLKIDTILSSEKFLEKAFGVDLGQNFDKVLSLETLKTRIKFLTKLKNLIRSFFNLDSKLPEMSQDQIACVLFTSGSESAPKAVPLTHKNIFANMRGALAHGLIKDDDRFLATLPPFHSFGCVVSGLLPILCGLDTIYLPDPTDSTAISSAIKQTKATLFCSAPSFLKQILVYHQKYDLDSLRLVVVGAEKLQESVKELFAQSCPHACLLEGYGITECSPVVTLQENALTKGVGKPLKGIKLLIVDPDSLTPLPVGDEGEILVSGDNVFGGYLGLKKDPFVMIEGQKWYRTGDRGRVTAHQELILSGRFKRFIKISAEMISLGAIEEALDDFKEPLDGVAQFAVIADKSSEKLILVTIYPHLELDDVNHHLRLKGLPKVAKISSIRHVDAIPQLATGKIDYRTLEHAHI